MSILQHRLKKLREESDYTQLQLSGMLNIGNVSLSQYENGTRTPDIDTIVKIAEFYDVTTDYLLGRTNDPQGNIETEEETPYYINDDAREMAQEIYENPELRILFDASRNLETDDIKAVVDIVRRLKKE